MNELLMPLLGGLLRTGIAAFGAYLGTYGLTVSGSMQEQMLGAALVVVSLALSGASKWWAARAARTGAVAAAKASAEATMKAGIPTPVTVKVTAVGQENVATKVSRAEAVAAPSVPVNVEPSPAPQDLGRGQ